jgi:hypothetical protein
MSHSQRVIGELLQFKRFILFITTNIKMFFLFLFYDILLNLTVDNGSREFKLTSSSDQKIRSGPFCAGSSFFPADGLG